MSDIELKVKYDAMQLFNEWLLGENRNPNVTYLTDKVLQTIPAQPGYFAVEAVGWAMYSRTPIIAWATIEVLKHTPDNVNIDTAIVPVTPSPQFSYHDLSYTRVLDPTDNSFMGIEYPGMMADWPKRLAELTVLATNQRFNSQVFEWLSSVGIDKHHVKDYKSEELTLTITTVYE